MPDLVTEASSGLLPKPKAHVLYINRTALPSWSLFMPRISQSEWQVHTVWRQQPCCCLSYLLVLVAYQDLAEGSRDVIHVRRVQLFTPNPFLLYIKLLHARWLRLQWAHWPWHSINLATIPGPSRKYQNTLANIRTHSSLLFNQSMKIY